jgi:hypothetical protein
MRGTHMMMVTRRMRYPKIKHVAVDAPVRNTHGAQCAMRGGAHGAQWNYAFEHQHVRWLRGTRTFALTHMRDPITMRRYARHAPEQIHSWSEAHTIRSYTSTNAFVERSTHDGVIYIFKSILEGKNTRSETPMRLQVCEYSSTSNVRHCTTPSFLPFQKQLIEHKCLRTTSSTNDANTPGAESLPKA